jgi:hypothetical protein
MYLQMFRHQSRWATSSPVCLDGRLESLIIGLTFFHFVGEYGVSVHLGEMAAESGAFCRRFLLLSHPR